MNAPRETEYSRRVAELVAEGMTNSDAQAIADHEGCNDSEPLVSRGPQPVDVLAVIDHAFAFCERENSGPDVGEMRDARVAVTELIEAVRDHLESMDSYPTDLVPMNRRSGTTKPLRAALARIGGGQ